MTTNHFHLAFACLVALVGIQSDAVEKRQPGSLLHASLRTDIQISGIYPHLTTYGIYSQNGDHDREGHNECGIGAVVPWAGKLWMVNYAPHMPNGSEHKLFSVDPELTQPMTVHPESVGGTPAGWMIHRESNQLLIAHYLIDATGEVRTISPRDMPMRVTAIARHLVDPANMVYYIDMEGAIWEANVHTLAVTRLFAKPVPGWHGKGGYTAQGRLVVSNNGEYKAGSYDELVVGGPPQNKEEAGVLAEWDGSQWSIVERRQFTEVTGPDGIHGGSDADSPLWAIGWDRRSLRLKLLDYGEWRTYLLPKAAHNNDPIHGWYTEWPRIREIGGGKLMMDMHGMFFDFPKTFSRANTAGLRPIASHLRYVPDFCEWNGQLVLASDETSIQGTPLAGQPQRNLWFGAVEDLKSWGPASGYGGPWVGDEVKAGVASDPFLIAGFDRRCLHLSVGRAVQNETAKYGLRATDQQPIHRLPAELAALPRLTVERGDWHKPAPGYSFTIDRPATVYLAVDRRGEPKLNPDWTATEMTLTWGENHHDQIYQRSFHAGVVEIPGNACEHTKGSFGMPHTAFVASNSGAVTIKPSRGAHVSQPVKIAMSKVAATQDGATADGRLEFRLEIDRLGRGEWEVYDTIAPNEGYVAHELPVDLRAEWMRIIPNQDCVATAYFHLTDGTQPDRSVDATMFDGLADVRANAGRNKSAPFRQQPSATILPEQRNALFRPTDGLSALLYPAKKNRNLQLIASGDRFLQFTKDGFEFSDDQPDAKLKKLLEVEPAFTVDEASVILQTQGRRWRLPKGDAAFDLPFAAGWPRGSREVESERHLANFHGTFYEVPLITNGAPPAFDHLRPVASHAKQIFDFCSWNGLLVLSGVRSDATADGHVFIDDEHKTGLWFGGVDDLWKLGKPVGRGGPWLNSSVQANAPSDAYLMTGYDK
ncbi:MAG: sulfatase, partial [Planctomycetia bacterium]|nr:sulfatase [Planctomycetia bacterium]